MKKSVTGIFFIITGIILSLFSLKLTGAVIGFSKTNYFGLIGISLLLIGGFLSIEEKVQQKSENFRRRLKMARVSQPLYYAFSGGKEYNPNEFRTNLKRTRGNDKKHKLNFIKFMNSKGGDRDLAQATYNKLTNRYDLPSTGSYETYAHEFIHRLGDIGLIPNDYVMARAVDSYIELMKYRKKAEESFGRDVIDYVVARFKSEKPTKDEKVDTSDKSWFPENPFSFNEISRPENLRPLSKKERTPAKLEYSKELGFQQTGASLGTTARRVEAISGKVGSGLYFLKLVSEGVSPEKARETVMGDYAPLTEFEKKYGRRWKRILGS